MAQIVLFHSSFGLRQAEAAAAGRLRAAGHHVLTPDLFAGQTVTSHQAARVLMDGIGWAVICERARRSLDSVPADAVLAGFSMGVGVIGSVWDERQDAAGMLLLHGVTPVPAGARPGLPVQVHVAENDPFAPAQAVTQWRAGAAAAGVAAEVFSYPGAGHFYTDPDLADYDAPSATLTWQRVLTFLSAL
jgi:dienelactone hydrolase